MAKKKKYQQTKPRNYVVVNMLRRAQGAGLHKDQKKEASRTACRKPVEKDN